MAAISLVPVFRHAQYRAYPKHAEGGRARYMPIGDALSASYPSDAHLACYSVPSVARRLDINAPDRLPDGVPMVLFVADVDCEESHRASGGTGDAPAPDAWWIEELPKIGALRAEHPGAFVHRTRGGYRIVYALPEPFAIRTGEDAAEWKTRYCSWGAHLTRRFGIHADPSCKDWPHLFRLPHATREEGGRPEMRETIGDPTAVGMWRCEPSAEDMEAGEKLAHKHARAPGEKRKPRAVETCTNGAGVLFEAFKARNWIGQAIEAGKWSIECPWEKGHTKGARFDTSTILFGPHAGEVMGWFHCSHNHCTERTLWDVLALFSPGELDRAREAAGMRRTAVQEVKIDVVGSADADGGEESYPEFPDRLFDASPTLRAVYEWQRDYTEAAPAFIFAGALMILSLAMGKRVYAPGRRPVYANLYQCIAGPPGSKKSVAVEIPSDAMRIIDQRIIPVTGGFGSPEGLFKHVGAKNPIEPSVFVGLDELGTLIRKTLGRASMNRPAPHAGSPSVGGGATILCHAFDGKDVSNYTQKEQVLVTRPYVCLAGTCTPDVAAVLLADEAKSSGLTSRFLFVLGRPGAPIPIPDTPDEARGKAIFERIIRMVNQAAAVNRGRLGVTAAATRRFSEFYCDPSIRKAMSSDEGLARLTDHVWKLAGILTPDNEAPAIDAPQVENAIGIMDYFRACYAHLSEHCTASLRFRIEGRIVRALEKHGALSYRDLQQHASGGRGGNAETFADAHEHLRRRGRIDSDEGHRWGLKA